MRARTSIPLGFFAAGAAGLGWTLAEARAFTLRRFTLPVLPEGSEPLRVLHVSDLHLVPRQQKKAAWLRSLGELRPDLVVSTGDNLAALDAVPATLRAYGDLLDLPGVFVLGSNDYYAPKPKNPIRYFRPRMGSWRLGPRLPTSELTRGFKGAGWLDLTNRRDELKIGDHRFEFVGVDDPHLRRDRYADVAGPADPNATLTIGVTHAPYQRVLNEMTADGAGLVLAGHTHGGQVCVPFYGALVTNCDLDRKRAKGVSRWPVGGVVGGPQPEASMHVSAGLGTSPFTPVRFACRPEASLLTLVSRRSEA